MKLFASVLLFLIVASLVFADTTQSSPSQKAPPSDASNTQKAPPTDVSTTVKPPLTDSSNTQKAPPVDASNTQKAPLTDSSNTQKAPPVDVSTPQKTPLADTTQSSPVEETSSTSKNLGQMFPAFFVDAVQRKKTIKDDHTKVKKYHTAASLLGVLPPGSSKDVSTPEIETEAYFGYPMTLDYVVNVYVQSTDGTTSPYSVIADTGSSNLAVSVDDCSDCGSGSSTLEVDYYEPSLCVEVTYGSGSWSGLMTDSTFVSMGSTEQLGTNIYFSAITDGSSFFTSSGFQGILGLGYSGICSDYTTCPSYQPSQLSTTSINALPYTDSLADDGIISENIFTMNFCEMVSNIAIGGIDSSQYTGDITYVDTQKTYNSYYGYFLVNVDAISIDGVDIGDVSSMNSIGGTLVDSGTTLLYVTSSVYKTIKASVENSLTSISSSFFQWSSCISEDDLSSLPTITFTIDTYELNLSPSDYLLYYSNCYYWGISSSSVPIIGNIALQDLFIVFDKENNQVGFADAVCAISDSTSEKVKEQIKGNQNAVKPKSNFDQIDANVPQLQGTVMVSVYGLIIVGAVVAGVSYLKTVTRTKYQLITN